MVDRTKKKTVWYLRTLKCTVGIYERDKQNKQEKSKTTYLCTG